MKREWSLYERHGVEGFCDVVFKVEVVCDGPVGGAQGQLGRGEEDPHTLWQAVGESATQESVPEKESGD